MSIYKAMWAGVSGLTAESQALGVVGDNIAKQKNHNQKQMDRQEKKAQAVEKRWRVWAGVIQRLTDGTRTSS